MKKVNCLIYDIFDSLPMLSIRFGAVGAALRCGSGSTK
jgi:hypothetical protein